MLAAFEQTLKLRHRLPAVGRQTLQVVLDFNELRMFRFNEAQPLQDCRQLAKPSLDLDPALFVLRLLRLQRGALLARQVERLRALIATYLNL